MCDRYKVNGLERPNGPCGSYNWAVQDRRVENGLPGDAVCIYVASKGRIGHIGMFVAEMGNSVKSIDGNVSNQVSEVMRFKSEVQLYDWISERE